MTWISKTITTFGLVLVAHACYSAHEHSALQSLRAASAATSTATSTLLLPSPSSSLPLDISIETVFGLFLTVLGLVANTPKLRPIQWRVWAGKVEREGAAGFVQSSGGDVDKDFVGNPFRVLETRPGFVNIRAQRKEFAEWVRTGSKS